MRVGLVAKGLLLKGDLDLELVLLCKEKPTIILLKKVSENLLAQLKVRIVTQLTVCPQYACESTIIQLTETRCDLFNPSKIYFLKSTF